MSWLTTPYNQSQSDLNVEEPYTSSGSSCRHSWVGSASSSDSDAVNVDHDEKYLTNCDIEDCHCSKYERALSAQQDTHRANNKTQSCKKFNSVRPNLLKPSFNGDSEDDVFQKALSMPENVSEELCHCLSCCKCSAREQISGRCPIFLQKSSSTRSLDRAMDDLQYSIKNHGTVSEKCTSNGRNSMSHDKDVNDLSKSPVLNSDSVILNLSPSHRTIRPNYYSQSLQRKCKMCGKLIRQWHLPVKTKDLPVLPQCMDYCNCKIFTDHGKRRCSNSNKSSAKQSSSLLKDKVDPKEYKSKANTICTWFGDFNNEQKNLLLKKLLEECDLPQFHMLSSRLGPQLHYGCPPNCEDIITWLPDNVANKIFSYLDPVSLCKASLVCQSWKVIADNPSFWQKFTSLPQYQLSKKGAQKQLLNHVRPNGEIHWKRVFAERFRLRKNWLKGRCTIRTFEGHTQGISCVQFDETRIVSGSSDRTIKVWNIRTNSPWSVQTLVGHSGTVRCLHLDGNRLVSGSTDNTIKVWDLSTQQSWSSIACKVTMVGGHTDTVRCLQVDDEKVISGSYDQTLKIWDLKTGQCKKTLRGHTAAVLCVQFDEEKIMSGSCDKTIKIWNFSGSCVMTLDAHQDAVTCLQFDSTRIVSGSLDCNIKFWDIKTGQCINTIDWKASEGHTGVVRCLQADSWRVVSASDDKTIKVWSLDTCERLVTLKNHTDGVTCLQFNDSIIVSGSYDRTVILRDFSCV